MLPLLLPPELLEVPDVLPDGELVLLPEPDMPLPEVLEPMEPEPIEPELDDPEPMEPELDEPDPIEPEDPIEEPDEPMLLHAPSSAAAVQAPAMVVARRKVERDMGSPVG